MALFVNFIQNAVDLQRGKTKLVLLVSCIQIALINDMSPDFILDQRLSPVFIRDRDRYGKHHDDD